MRHVLTVLDYILQLYMIVIIATAVMSWLLAFDIVNYRNNIVRSIWATLTGLTEPVLAPIRRRLPNTGGIDISPVIVFIVIWLIRMFIGDYI